MIAKLPLNGKTSATAAVPGSNEYEGRANAGQSWFPERLDTMDISCDFDPRSAQWSHGQRPPAVLRRMADLVKLNTLLMTECALLADALAKARRFAYHDPLTGLPNRRLLLDRFDQAKAQAMRKHNSVTLLFLDLDGFKGINDSIGHVAADQLLQQVASRLSSCVRSSDTACRYGGDELVVLLPDINGPAQAVAACEKIHRQLALPYDIDGTRIRAIASLGMATFPDDGTEVFELIQAADLAMYREKGKKQGRSPANRTATIHRRTANTRAAKRP